MLDVRTSPAGRIALGDEELTQAEAVQTAVLLILAVQRSLDRNQIGTAAYTDTSNIIRRSEAPLGRAVKALLELEFDGVRQAWLKA